MHTTIVKWRTAVAVLSLCGFWAFAPRPAWGQVAESREAESEDGEERPGADAERPDPSKVARQIVTRTNDFRAKEGRKPVETDRKLAAAAQYFADYMARTNRYGHTADGRRPSQRAADHGYDYCLVSENIAHAFDSRGFTAAALSDQFTRGWINSPGHRKNMLDSDVVHTGVAVARTEGGRYYAVQMFGRPESMKVRFSVANRAKVVVTYRVDDRSFELPPRVTRTHEACRPPTLVVNLGRGAEAPSKTLSPADGAAFVVEPAQGDALVVREADGGKRGGDREKE